MKTEQETPRSYFEVDEEKSKAFDRMWGTPGGWFPRIKTINNIPVAKRYIAASFAFLFAGGFMALLMRWQLAVPENDFLDVETYNQLFTMHGTTMMFLFVIPFIEAVANYFMPLLLGARDLPYPRLTALAFWTYLWGGLFIYSSFLFGVAPAGGWFAYVPMTNRNYMPGIGMDFWDIGLSVAEIAAMGAAAEIIVAILRMRAPGISLNRLPIFGWAMLITAFMIIFAFTPLIVATAMLEFDRKGLTSFFVPEVGGEPLLWQHLFWIFGHPEVYIMFIPAVGVVSQVLPVFARRPLVSYPLVVLSLVATGFISFGLWVHHMFATGLSPVAMGFFAAASMLIAIPSGVQMFVWIATLWTGRPVFRTPLLFIIGFIVIFVIGGVTGVMVGAPPFDDQVHDTYFIVAHLHYVLIGGVVFPFYAGLYYWIPKITGRMLSERLGKWNFWMMFVFFHVTFFPMHISGLLGMPRRVYTYPADLGWDVWNLISTIGALGFGAGAVLILVNFVWHLKHGRKAGPNPWGADTLEWWENSPPPNAQFKFIPFVRSRHPLWEQDSFEPRDEQERKLVEPLRSAPTEWRGALVVSVLDGRPLAIVKMPHPTYAPFIMSIGFVFLFAGALFENLWIGGTGALITAVALYLWFRPREDEVRAIREIGTDSRADKLPLAVAGPLSNGWWGMLVFVLVLTVALFTFVASYFYLGEGPDQWPPVVPDLRLPGWATAAALGAAAATYAYARGIRREQLTLRRLGAPAALGLWGVFTWLAVRAWTDTGLVAKESAYASAFVGLLAFQWVVMIMVLLLLAVVLLWTVFDPEDPRGHATSLNTELLSYFAAASWVVVFVTLYLTPRLW
jgi:cytochrome c oxidase subunit I+III